MTKDELISELEDSRNEMVELLDEVPDDEMLTPGVVGGWSIKDILAHLTHWEGQLVTLLFQAKRGQAKPSTAHFGTESVDDLNQRWFEAGKDRLFDQIWQDWVSVRKQTIRRVGEFTDQELNDPQAYPWLNGRALWEWIASDTFEHEEEHADQISDWLERFDPGEGIPPGSNGHQH